MYSSVKDWCTIPIDHKQLLGMDGAGDKKYSEPETIYCYIEGSVEMIHSLEGDQVTTSRKVYVDEDTAFRFWPLRDRDGTGVVGSDLLKIDGREYPVLAVAPFYDSGKVSLAVIYV